MRKPKKEIHLTSYEELLGIEDNQENSVDKITEIPIDCLYGFKNHPFYVINDEKMQETVDSIKEYGVLNPCIVRPREGGGYEIISGHRRKYACQLAGKAKIPAIIRNYTDDENIRNYLSANIERLSSPWLFKDMDRAVDILKIKIAAGNKIRIICDYDVDGVCSGYILYRSLKNLGAVVDVVVPHLCF